MQMCHILRQILLWPRMAPRADDQRSKSDQNVVNVIFPVPGSALQELIIMPNSAY